jgi:DNA-binding response OmpR family regulator
MRTLLGRIAELLGFAPLLAFDGVEAIEQANNAGDELAAAILDVTMAQLNGIEVATVLRAEHPSLPIILISNRPLTVMGRSLEVPPGVQFFTKPFGINELEDALWGASEPTNERSLGAGRATA